MARICFDNWFFFCVCRYEASTKGIEIFGIVSILSSGKSICVSFMVSRYLIFNFSQVFFLSFFLSNWSNCRHHSLCIRLIWSYLRGWLLSHWTLLFNVLKTETSKLIVQWFFIKRGIRKKQQKKRKQKEEKNDFQKGKLLKMKKKWSHFHNPREKIINETQAVSLIKILNMDSS